MTIKGEDDMANIYFCPHKSISDVKSLKALSGIGHRSTFDLGRNGVSKAVLAQGIFSVHLKLRALRCCLLVRRHGGDVGAPHSSGSGLRQQREAQQRDHH